MHAYNAGENFQARERGRRRGEEVRWTLLYLVALYLSL
jgi:hypothetical protein